MEFPSTWLSSASAEICSGLAYSSELPELDDIFLQCYAIPPESSQTVGLGLCSCSKQTLSQCSRQVVLIEDAHTTGASGTMQKHFSHQAFSHLSKASQNTSACLQALHLQMYAVACMAKLRKAVDKYYLVGVTGLQSGGKSTLTEKLTCQKVMCHAQS